eukprot:UN29194
MSICINDDSSVDQFADTCTDWYDEHRICTGDYDIEGQFSSAQQCCACGGGFISRQGFCRMDQWNDVKVLCDGCTSLANNMYAHKTCDNYCAAQEGGMRCVGAWEENSDDCNKIEEHTCDFDFADMGTSDALCKCVYKPPVCNEDVTQWVDYDNMECGGCVVLADNFSSKYQTCDNYCQAQNMECVGAWEDKSDSCVFRKAESCYTDFSVEYSGTSDALCQCTEYTCDYSTWTDIDGGVVCDNCTVLVDNMKRDWQTCTAYCAAQEGGLKCTGAWEEHKDTCEIEATFDCDHVFGYTSDALCRCSGRLDGNSGSGGESGGSGGAPEPPTPQELICDVYEWTDVRVVDCGDCTVLTKNMDDFWETCHNYCAGQEGGLQCVGAWEEHSNTCEVKSTENCHHEFSYTSDALCQCTGGSDYNPGFTLSGMDLWAKRQAGTNQMRVQFLMIDTVILVGTSYHNEQNNQFVQAQGPLKLQKALNYWTWIENELATSDADYLWVVGHYAIHSVCSHGPNDYLLELLKPLLEQYGATGYISGHDHCASYIEEKQEIQVDLFI